MINIGGGIFAFLGASTTVFMEWTESGSTSVMAFGLRLVGMATGITRVPFLRETGWNSSLSWQTDFSVVCALSRAARFSPVRELEGREVRELALTEELEGGVAAAETACFFTCCALKIAECKSENLRRFISRAFFSSGDISDDLNALYDTWATTFVNCSSIMKRT